jgi:putative sigma-54 modulation protein
MTVTIVGRNIQLTQALKNVIYGKVRKLDKKYFHGRTNYSIKVILRVEQKNYIAEVLAYRNKKVLKKSFSSNDMYKSINETFDILDRTIRKQKEKTRTKRLQRMQELKVHEMKSEDESDNIFEDDEEVRFEPQ